LPSAHLEPQERAGGDGSGAGGGTEAECEKSAAMIRPMVLAGHDEEIDGYICFVETSRGKKTVHFRQPIEEYRAEINLADQKLADLCAWDKGEITLDEFLEKYLKKYGI
jgi:hypothetical protein